MIRLWVAALMAAGLSIFSQVATAAHPSVSISRSIIDTGNATTVFPPSFLGHPLAYSGALFSELTILSFSLAIIFFMLSNMNLKRDSCLRGGVRTWKSPVNVYRISIILFMASVCFNIAPNLLIYLAWGGVESDTMVSFLTADKILKTFSVVPFVAGVYLVVENDEVVTMQLSFGCCPEPLWPSAASIKEHYKTVALVFLLSVGVTYAKWGANVQL